MFVDFSAHTVSNSVITNCKFAHVPNVQLLHSTKAVLLLRRLTLCYWLCAGFTGLIGDPGSKGRLGDPGPEGRAGNPGQQGPSGQAGPRGPTGATGFPGSIGEKGLQGQPGRQGLLLALLVLVFSCVYCYYLAVIAVTACRLQFVIHSCVL